MEAPGHISKDQCLMSIAAETENPGAADVDRHPICITQRNKHHFKCETMRVS